jgi:hypothetical protein
MPRIPNRKTQPLAIPFSAAALICASLPALAESGIPPRETTGRAIPDETIDTERAFARRPATRLERAPSGLDPQSHDSGCALLEAPQGPNTQSRRGSGPLGPHLMMGVE